MNNFKRRTFADTMCKQNQVNNEFSGKLVFNDDGHLQLNRYQNYWLWTDQNPKAQKFTNKKSLHGEHFVLKELLKMMLEIRSQRIASAIAQY